ncbi:MAG: inositol monophosphatase family protein [Anaerolineae bacterium]|nr:inositol monophosphatase [Candidatus Roseilinea sp.]MDW8449635.1 inositol monophosphatase family protein [Anaerolineae bacterium]
MNLSPPHHTHTTVSEIPARDLLAILDQATVIARGAGAILREGLRQIEAQREEVTVQYKSGDTDPVTEFDHRSEAFIVEALQKAFPDHRVVGEEGGAYELRIENGELRERDGESLSRPSASHNQLEWQVDPLDGTVNFAHGFPVFAVSLGLLVDGAPVLGVVYDPMSDEMYTAAHGLGATLNGRPIRVSNVQPLAFALLNTGFPYDRRESEENNFDYFLAFQRASQEVRRVGSAALDLCWVACGRMDGYWELKIQPHDIAAGIAIVREAGGVVTDFDGGQAMFARQQAVASNGLIHAEMLNVIRETRDARRRT